MSVAKVASDYLYQGLDFSQPVKRVGVRTQSDNSIYGPGAKMTLTFPQSWADFRQSYLTIDALVTRTGGTYIRFSYPIQCIFSQCTIKLGGEIVEFIDNFQVLQGLFKEASDLDSVTSVYNEGDYSSAANRATQAAGRTYNVHLRLESLLRVLPLHKINQPLQLILQVAPSTTFIETDGAVNLMQFSNVFYNYFQIDGTADQAAALQASINAGLCQIQYHTWENYNTSMATATTQTMSVPVRRRNVNAIIVGARLQSIVNNPISDQKFVDNFALSALPIVAYAKVNNQPYPSDFYQMNGLGLGYYQMSIVFNGIMESDFYAHYRQQTTFSNAAPTSRQVYAFDLRQDSSPGANKLWNNGVNTADSSNSAVITVTYGGASGAAVYDVFSKYEAVITVSPGMSAKVSS